MGLRMPEKIARSIEELSKGLPKDFTYRRLAKATTKFELQAGERADISTITTDAVDRDGECVIPKGGDWNDYNRVVTFCHLYDQLPVGSNWWMKAVANSIIAKTGYPVAPPDWQGPWLPSAILHLMQQPVPTCTGKSIGFLPLNIRTATREEIDQRPELKNVPIIDRWRGIEYAVCTVAANQQADMLVVSKCRESGMIDGDTADIVRKGMEAFAPIIKIENLITQTPVSPELLASNAPTPRRSIVIPAPSSPIIINSPNRSKSKMATPAAYQHLDFQPPKDVVKAHKEGVERDEAGESAGHATPEMVAMARHCAMGGECSPDFARKCKYFHEANPNHTTAKPGTPACCLAMLHGGVAGKAYYGELAKSMDMADSAPGPGPATAIDENSATTAAAKAAKAKKDAMDGDGGSENSMADGGAAVRTEAMPMCPACKVNKDVTMMKPADGETKATYGCKMCGKEFSAVETIGDTGVTGPDAVDGGAMLPGADKPAEKVVTLVAQKMSEADMELLVGQILESEHEQLEAKAIAKAEDMIILSLGGV